MKSTNLMAGLVFSIVFMGCANDDTEIALDLENDVEAYVELVRTNQFNESDIPAFSPSDIPALLIYRNSTDIVDKFPANLLSSYSGHGRTHMLGILVLWTIESIRVNSIETSSLVNSGRYLRFPSLNPILVNKNNSSEWILDHDVVVYEKVGQAYFDWWELNKTRDFDDFKNIHPLEKTDYMWH